MISPQIPSLPQRDPRADGRREALVRDRRENRFTSDYHGLVFAAEVPASDRISPKYVARAIEVLSMLAMNRVTATRQDWPEHEPSERWSLPGALVSAAPYSMARRLRGFYRELLGAAPKARPTSFRGYESLYGALERPASMKHWRTDESFAWQRIAGCNPVVIERVDRLPDNFPVTAEIFRRAVGETDSLDAAMAEGRLFLTDYALLDGLECQDRGGLKRYCWAPMALFVRSPRGALRPVAIQCGQRPDAGTPIYVPGDKLRWQMAKVVVQVADNHYHGQLTHFAWCHATFESIILATRRELAPTHPLRILLEPHFEQTLAINHISRAEVVGPDGQTENLMAATLWESLRLTREAVRDTPMTGIGIRADLSRRGVGDATALPVYPFRDDILPVADAIERWVGDYLRLYYQDEDVRSDGELGAWLSALRAPDQGRLAGVPDIESAAGLIRFVSDLVYRATAFHAAINYSCYDSMGFPPNQPTAAYGPGPSPHRDPTEADLLAMMPPLHLALRMMEFTYQLKVMRHNRLGDYPEWHFMDARVKPILSRFVRTLREIEGATAARDAGRPISYPYLLPSVITASIHV